MDPKTVIACDGWRGYNSLIDLGDSHYRATPSKDELAKGNIHADVGHAGIGRALLMATGAADRF